MTVYSVTPMQMPTDQAVIKPKEDVAILLAQAGITPLYYSRYVSWNDDNWASQIKGMLATVVAGDVVIYQTPTYAAPEVEAMIISQTHEQGAKIIGFVHDVEYLRYPQSYNREEGVAFLNSFDALMINTKQMRDQVVDSGVTVPIVEVGPWGYVQPFPKRRPQFSKDIHYAGNLVEWKAGFLQNLPADLHVLLYGSADGDDNLGFDLAPGVERMGSYSQEKLAMALDHGFGLIWDCSSNDEYNPYALINMPHKFSLYMSLGLPVIANANSAIGTFVQANGVGIVVNTMAELAERMAALDEDEYNAIADRVAVMSDLVRTGRHLQLGALNAVLTVNNVVPF
ncbi:MAG: galactofuranosyltransferase [Lactobacillus sp.]|nr:galactofuranosyltransferase [Lactobacillus sp.]